MSTNKSQNLKLHLWEPEDNFLRTEFNENFSAIDAALKAEADQRTALEQRVASTGHVIGSFTGNGSTQTITLGFKPSFVIISGQVTPASSWYYLNNLIVCASSLGEHFQRIATGFTVKYITNATTYTNREGITYAYLAFR
ncbi:MAG: hypothetical protein HFF18_11255 [Oscillospiraceae bacterium]|nr:hypothetical protein [Oscillospiraceae bacterium]